MLICCRYRTFWNCFSGSIFTIMAFALYTLVTGIRPFHLHLSFSQLIYDSTCFHVNLMSIATNFSENLYYYSTSNNNAGLWAWTKEQERSVTIIRREIKRYTAKVVWNKRECVLVACVQSGPLLRLPILDARESVRAPWEDYIEPYLSHQSNRATWVIEPPAPSA